MASAERIRWTMPLPTITGANRGELALISPTLVQTGWGEREGQAPRILDLQKPLGTIVGGGIKHALIAAFLAKHYGGNYNGSGIGMRAPLDTITTVDHHAIVHAFLYARAFPKEQWQQRVDWCFDGNRMRNECSGHIGPARPRSGFPADDPRQGMHLQHALSRRLPSSSYARGPASQPAATTEPRAAARH